MTSKKRYIDKEFITEVLRKSYFGENLTRVQNIFHQGQIGTLKSGYKYVRNDFEDDEYFKCKNDLKYFIESYCKLRKPELGNIKLRKYQIEWINEYLENGYINFLVSRQTGITQILTAIYIWEMIFNKKSIQHIDNKLSSSINFLDNIKIIYLNLPYFLKPSIEVMNSKCMKFTKDVMIKVRTITKSTTLSSDIISLHDYSRFINPILGNISMDLNSYKDSKIVIASRPNGNNHYYDLVIDSERKINDYKKNIFKTIRTYWWEVENRDIEWENNEIRNIGSKELFEQEYELKFNI